MQDELGLAILLIHNLHKNAENITEDSNKAQQITELL